ncbi:MAG: fatty acid desaturase, partial [Prochlorococcus sp. MED-G132]
HTHNKALLHGAKKLRITEIPDCFAYILWDSESNKLVTLAEANLQTV